MHYTLVLNRLLTNILWRGMSFSSLKVSVSSLISHDGFFTPGERSWAAWGGVQSLFPGDISRTSTSDTLRVNSELVVYQCTSKHHPAVCGNSAKYDWKVVCGRVLESWADSFISTALLSEHQKPFYFQSLWLQTAPAPPINFTSHLRGKNIFIFHRMQLCVPCINQLNYCPRDLMSLLKPWHWLWRASCS